MLGLDLHINTEKFKAPEKVAENFDAPLMFYLRHRKDKRNFLVSFVLLDFRKGESTYLTSYSLENLETIKNTSYQCPQIFKPHSSLCVNSNGAFLNFVENSPYFYLVDPANKKLKVLTGKDLPIPDNENITQFVSTIFPDDEDPNYFYFSALHQNSSEDKGVVKYYRSTLDLKKIEEIFTDPRGRGCPHVTKKHGNLLLNSDFSDVCFQVQKTGEIFDRAQLYKYVFRILFQEFCEQMSENFSEENFQKSISIDEFNGTYDLRPDFELYVQSLFGEKSFREICDAREEFLVKPVEGNINTINLSKNQQTLYHTTYSTPAHFELHPDGKCVFVSCHNFAKLEGGRTFFGPAAIDKFEITEKGLTKKESFSDTRGYRFTSHKVFSFGGKIYICTIGKPNRLFFINAENMSLEFHHDIGKNFLDDIGAEDMADFLNYHHPGHAAEYIALEVSDDGKFIFIVGHKTILIYNFEKRKMEEEIEILKSKSLFDDIDLSNFQVHTTHCQYLS